MTTPTFFYAVATIPTNGNTIDALADHAQARGADILHHGADHIQVSYGPFLSTSKNLLELRGDARHAAATLFKGIPHGTIDPLNATREADQHVIEFA